MHEFQQKKKIRKILYSPVVLILLLIITIFVIKGAWNVYEKDKLSAQNLKREKNELSKLLEREKNLAASLNYLKTDQGVENEIRTKFRAIKEGEKIAVIIDEQTPVTSTTTAEEHGFWYNLFHW
jgi:cell division protein FtsB